MGRKKGGVSQNLQCPQFEAYQTNNQCLETDQTSFRGVRIVSMLLFLSRSLNASLLPSLHWSYHRVPK